MDASYSWRYPVTSWTAPVIERGIVDYLQISRPSTGERITIPDLPIR